MDTYCGKTTPPFAALLTCSSTEVTTVCGDADRVGKSRHLRSPLEGRLISRHPLLLPVVTVSAAIPCWPEVAQSYTERF